jgi:chromosomal replication initiation ATPase DnaA
MNEYINLICYDRNVSIDEVKKDSRGEEHIANTRHVIAYCLYIFQELTLKETGRLLGGRHYSTIIHSIRKVNDSDYLHSYCVNLNLEKLEFDEYIDCKLGNIIMIKP